MQLQLIKTHECVPRLYTSVSPLFPLAVFGSTTLGPGTGCVGSRAARDAVSNWLGRLRIGSFQFGIFHEILFAETLDLFTTSRLFND